MEPDKFEEAFQRVVRLFMEALEQGESLINLYTDTVQTMTVSEDHVAAGVVLKGVISGLSSGPGSPRAKLNKVR